MGDSDNITDLNQNHNHPERSDGKLMTQKLTHLVKQKAKCHIGVKPSQIVQSVLDERACNMLTVCLTYFI